MFRCVSELMTFLTYVRLDSNPAKALSGNTEAPFKFSGVVMLIKHPNWSKICCNIIQTWRPTVVNRQGEYVTSTQLLIHIIIRRPSEQTA